MNPLRARRPSKPSDTALETLSALAVAANRGETLAGALPSLLEILCTAGGWDLGHAYRVAPGEELYLPLNTWWTPGTERFEPFRRATAEIPIVRHGLIEVIRGADGPVWIEEIREVDWLLRKEAALEAGLRSMLAFPVVGPRRMAGMIELLSREPRAEDPSQMQLARHAGIVLGQILEREGVEARFRALFDLLPIPVAVTALDDARFVEANSAMAEFVGLPRDEMYGATPDELGIVVHGWNREERIRQLREATDSATVEARIRTDPAGARDVIATVSIVPWEGRPHLLASLIDMTRVKSAEKQVGRSQARVHALTARLLQLQEEERARLSRELHDHLGQRLSALKIILDRLGRRGVHSELVEAGGEIARELLDDVRDMSFELRPAILDQLGLPAAIRRYVERSAEAAGIRADIDLDESVTNLSDRSTTACFRVLQEAVTNVLRHAEAGRLSVRLGQVADDTLLTVEDDGVGFDPEAAEQDMGLMIMEERVEGVGGRLTVSSRPGQGTTVEARFPAGPAPLPPQVERR